MEFLIQHLGSIFCYLTGTLIAWSLYLSYEHHEIITATKAIHEEPHKHDVYQMIGLIIISLFLTSSLYAFPNTITRFIDLLFVLELWYTVFLSYVSVNVYKSLKLLRNFTQEPNSPKHLGHPV